MTRGDRRTRGPGGLLLGWLLALGAGCLTEYTVGGAADDGGCPEGQVACKDGCVAAGSCDECADGQELCEGACVAAGTCEGGAECSPDQVKCGDACVTADSCPCEEGCDEHTETCAAGLCVCRDGLTRCGGACVDTRADGAHCGGCDGACASLCRASACVQACDASDQTCGGGCVDVNTDVLHCGECGERCSSDELCVEGECRGYQEIPDCAMCPCEDACEEFEVEGECCDSVFLGGPVCVHDGCD